MKLSWTEPWCREVIRQRVREANLAMPSVGKISLWGGILSLGAMIGVRLLLPESGEMLTWERMIGMALACASYPWIEYLPVVVPMGVRLDGKRIFFQCGNTSSWVPYNTVLSISFEDRNGLNLFVVRAVTKQGKEFEHIALTSPKYSDEAIAKFLLDIGMAHLMKR